MPVLKTKASCAPTNDHFLLNTLIVLALQSQHESQRMRVNYRKHNLYIVNIRV